jgi:site-specific recombinase XerD
MGITHAALTFFYNFTCRRDMPFLKIYRNRKASRIPLVLSQQQVFDALNRVRDERYRACLILIYSCGLRAGEAVKLECSNINKQTSLLHVRYGKGDKDRLIPIPERTLQILREMWKKHHHSRLLFPAYYLNSRLPQKRYGAKNKPFSVGVIATHFKAALKASGYKGKATLHTLRHSYATHLLEAGVPLFTVKSYLGHSCVKSTMIYVHCTGKMRRDSAGAVDGLTHSF